MVKMTLSIDGMMCGMCETHVNEAIRKAFSVKKVTSSHKKGQTEIIAQEALPEEQLRQAIGTQGYTLEGLKVEPYEKKGLFHRG